MSQYPSETISLRIKCQTSQSLKLDINPRKPVHELLKEISKLTGIPHEKDQMILRLGFPPKRLDYARSMRLTTAGFKHQDTIIVEHDKTKVPGGEDNIQNRDPNSTTSTPNDNVAGIGFYSPPKVSPWAGTGISTFTAAGFAVGSSGSGRVPPPQTTASTSSSSSFHIPPLPKNAPRLPGVGPSSETPVFPGSVLTYDDFGDWDVELVRNNTPHTGFGQPSMASRNII
jgi:hypothetical protein